MLDIERRSVAYIWDTFCTRGTLTSNKCAKVGPKPKYSPDDIRNLVRDVPMDQRSTTRDISAATGLSMGTLSRHLKMGIFVRRSTRIKPLLTDANKAERTAFYGMWSIWTKSGSMPTKIAARCTWFPARPLRSAECPLRSSVLHVLHTLRAPANYQPFWTKYPYSLHLAPTSAADQRA
ncbi:hypothetical protein H257_05261 [Aphanomyces astaci]|uniref:Transposase Tc1-like domain-containing protein n=1 Tax=Aphanomyces astaci TaxID=112090 RepID=W4GUK8_APHAT|nr:hypothetical protein H257_05261 [Aphanomyces astaci]ETV82699.1 hypothetical protein H257_05261 [Aphanomyces astaci]RQM31191.1 hypothetical protein B5M09_009261 [Aphanomyces astaci]|eukprot:XP_009828368.1 hypothetical protein H257_05261 [Aphanomyces astaci]